MDKKKFIKTFMIVFVLVSSVILINKEMIELEQEVDRYKEEIEIKTNEIIKLNQEIEEIKEQHLVNYKELVSELEDTIKRNR